ncbi:MAG: hypothetical protein ACI305_07340 [Lepagella sp.]
METKTNSTPKNPHLVMRVALAESIRSIPVGNTVTFDCRDAGPYTSAKGTVSRLNKAAGREEFAISSSDNGSTYTITRK